MSEVDLEKAESLIKALSIIADNAQALYVVVAIFVLVFVYGFTKMILDYRSDSRNNNVIEENSRVLGKVEAVLTQLVTKLSSQ